VKLEDLKVIVTGGAGGMGRHFAIRLHEAGAKVAVGDIDKGALYELPSGIHHRVLDVTSEDDCIDFVHWSCEQMDGLNALINNAGIIRDGLLVKKRRDDGAIKKLPLDTFQAVLDVNLLGATLMVREVVARMLETDAEGVIVNMSSISRYGNRGQSNYVAAKAALSANTRTWANEFARYGIRVGAVAPGMVATPMTAGMNQAALKAVTERIPVGRIGTPEDIWLGVKFVLECDYFNGRTLDIDGGVQF
jgi:3-oxoacyl-[acyl-carrier protein] reductase